MRITYCPQCNNFFYSKRISNYCKTCRTQLYLVPIPFDEFTKLSLNERYVLAYQITNDYEGVVKKYSKDQ